MHYVWPDRATARSSALCLDRQKRASRQNAKARGARGLARGRKRGNAKAGTAAKRQSAWRGGSRGLAKAATAAKRQSAWRGAGVALGEGAAFFSQRLGQPQILRLSRKGQNLGFNTTTKTTSARTGTTHCNDNLSAGLPTSGGGGTQGGGQRRSFREEALGEAKAGPAALAGWKCGMGRPDIVHYVWIRESGCRGSCASGVCRGDASGFAFAFRVPRTRGSVVSVVGEGEEAYLYKSVFRGTSPLAAALGAAARGWQAPPGGGIGRWIEMSVKCA